MGIRLPNPSELGVVNVAQREATDPAFDAETRSFVLNEDGRNDKRSVDEWREFEQMALQNDLLGGGSNFLRYARRWGRIRTDQGLVPLQISYTQMRIHQTIQAIRAQNRPVRLRILKPRQIYASTYSQCRQYHFLAFEREGVTSLTVAQDVETAAYLLRMSKCFLDETPEFLRPEIRFDNKRDLYFKARKSGATIKTAKDARLLHGQTYSFIHASEVSRWGDSASQTALGLYNGMRFAPGTIAIEESTAWGASGYFYNVYQNTQALMDAGKQAEWVNLFISWLEHPAYTMPFRTAAEEANLREHLTAEEVSLVEQRHATFEQLNWRRAMIEASCQGDVNLFHEMFPCHWREAFVSSGRPYFDRIVLVGWQAQAEAEPPPVKLQIETGIVRIIDGKEQFFPVIADLDVYEQPEPGKEYVIGADTAEGVDPSRSNRNPDFSVADAGALDNGRQVAELRGRFDPDVFAAYLVKVGEFYNNALIVVEANGYGKAVLDELQGFGYVNVYFSVLQNGSPKAGLQTTTYSKGPMMRDSKAWIRDNIGRIRSRVSIAEHMGIESDEHGKAISGGGHDDCVMARAVRIVAVKREATVTSEAEERELTLPERVAAWQRAKRAALVAGREWEQDGSFVDDSLGAVI